MNKPTRLTPEQLAEIQKRVHAMVERRQRHAEALGIPIDSLIRKPILCDCQQLLSSHAALEAEKIKLQDYAKHINDSPVFCRAFSPATEHLCTCGLDELLREQEK